MFEIDRGLFTEQELILIIVQNEPNQVFELAGFLQSFIYHVLFMVVTPFLALPLLLIIGGCNRYPLDNYQMIPTKDGFIWIM